MRARACGVAFGALAAPLASAGCTSATSSTPGVQHTVPGADAGADAAVGDAAVADARGVDAAVTDAAVSDAAAVDAADAADAAIVDAALADADAMVPVPDLTLPADCNDGGANAGSRWRDLYACYFGSATGVASCAGTDDSCHGSTTSNGYLASQFFGGGFQCPPGDPTTCWMSITSSLVQDAGSDASSALLLQVLRHSPDDSCGPGGAYLCMPLSPGDLVFGPDDMARIASWISDGAKNN